VLAENCHCNRSSISIYQGSSTLRRTFAYSWMIGLIIVLVFGSASPAAVNAATIHHYEYVFTAGQIYVYDMDNGHALLKTVAVPTTAGVRGAVASVATGTLYISYGSDSGSGGFQLAYNLSTDHVVWTMSYGHGIDSQSISPDGKKIYMPSGEAASGGTWYVEDSSNGNDIATILSGGSGPHNTIVSPSGKRVYMGNRDFTSSAGTNDFDIADTATNLVVGRVTPLKSGVRPFTINSKETLSFITVSGFLGFQVGDLTTGKVIYTVPVDGSKIPGFTTQTTSSIPSHGISLSPDDKEIYLIDQPNSYVHIFDVSGLPGSAPVQVADIKLLNPMSGNEVGCAYDCVRNGWLHHSRDGRFVYVGDSGDVIDTLTRTTIATLPELANSRIEIEIDFQDTTPIWAATSRSSIGYVNPLPPTFTARITSPALGSTVSGPNVTVSTSVFTSGTISGVDLYKDGVLYASTTSSPYKFNWDTTKDVNGQHRLMVEAHDTAGNTTNFLATVSNTNPPSIATTSLPNAMPNTAYSATLAATGGTPPYTWSIASGALPAGLTLAPTTGVIAGTPTGSGTSNFTVQVKGADSRTATQLFALTVGMSPSITTTSLSNGTQNTAYSATLTATGGTTPYTWSIISGALPAGLALAPSTGVISGTPTVTGTSNFTVQVTSANSLTATQLLALTVNAPISIATTSLANGTQSTAYSATLTASGGMTPYTWSIVSGSLPAGLALAPGTAVISGTPTGSGSSNFTVQVTDANSRTATRSLNLTVIAPTPPSITTTSLPSGVPNTAYSATLAAAGGTTPYTWSIISGSLPMGLALAPSTGVISGTPKGGSSTSNFTVQVTDAKSLTATQPLSLTVSKSPSITTTSLANATQNTAYSAALAAVGGTTPYTWSIVSGTLPAGLALAPGSGVISGTPIGSGASNFTVQVADAKSQTATQPLTMTVVASTPLSITTTSLVAGTQNTAYSDTLAVTGGTTPYTWSIVSGALPAGLTLGSTTGVISGTPTGTGTGNFTVQVSDSNSLTATKPLTVTINSNGGAGGGIGLVQSNAIQGSGVGSLSVAFSASNAAGNLIIAFVRMSTTTQSATVTDSVGNVYTDAVTQVQTTDGHQVHIFYAKNILGGANTVIATFSATNNHPWLAIYEYRGLSTTSPLDQTASAEGSDASPNSGTALTTSANELLFAATGLPVGYTGTATAGSGYTMLQQDTNTSHADNEGAVVTSTGTYAATFSVSPSANWTAVLATFKP
jgi:hypothetical protein